jgi:2'-5' RNA ligase
MAKKKKKAPADAAKPPKLKADLPTQELAFMISAPRALGHHLWEMRHHWNKADPGWTWITIPFMRIVLALIKETTRSRMPDLFEIGQRISTNTPMFTVRCPRIERDAVGQKLVAALEPSPAMRELQLRLGQAILLGGFSLQEKGLPKPLVLLARRQEGYEPSCIKATKLLTDVPFDSWVVSKAHLVEARKNYDNSVYTSLRAWRLANSRGIS